MKLYVFPPSPRAFKVLFTADHLGLDYEPRIVDILKGEQNTPQFAALNPNRRMPVLDDDGYVLWESNAIVQYLASKKPEAGLLPDETRARLHVVRWQFWESQHWDPACAIFVFERIVKPVARGTNEVSASEIERATQLFKRCADVLEGQLGAHRFVAGDRLTVADFSIGAAMVAAERAQYPLAPYPAIRRWHGELAALPGWKKADALAEWRLAAA